MQQNDSFAQWASLFLDSADNASAEGSQPEQPAPVHYTGVTQAASALLQSIDSGGVPAFITANLLEIAVQNGIEVPDHWTPNEIIAAIRDRALSVATQ